MSLPTVSLKLTVYLVNLPVSQYCGTQRPDIKYCIALGAAPCVRLYGASRGPAAAYQDWHGDGILGR